MKKRDKKTINAVMKHGRLTKESTAQRVATRRFLAESCDIAKRLTHKNRILFIMRFESGFSTKEIADLCRCDETTVIRRIKEIASEIDGMRNCCKNGDAE